MIEPISGSTPPILQTPPRRSYSPLLTPSTLTSMGTTYACGIFTWLKNLFACIFCCYCPCYGEKAPPPKEGSDLPEHSPALLSSSDPFRNRFFLFVDSENWLFSNHEAYTYTSHLFSKMKEGGPFHWYQHEAELTQMQKALTRTPHHPLEMLFFQLMNEEKTAQVAHFQNHSTSKAISWVTGMLGRENPWKEYLDRHGKNLEKHEEDIAQYLPGFSKSLHLDLEKLQELANDKDWRGLTSYVVAERRAHFSV